MNYRWLNRVETCYSLLPQAPMDMGATVAPRLLDACSRTTEPVPQQMAAMRGYRLTTCDRKPRCPLVDEQDLLNLSYDDGAFAGVISSDTLEHVPEMATAIKELHRVTAPGGFLIACLPVCFIEDGKRKTTIRIPKDHPDVKWNHVWLPGLDLRDIMARVGYRLIAEMESFDFRRMRLSMIWMYEKC